MKRVILLAVIGLAAISCDKGCTCDLTISEKDAQGDWIVVQETVDTEYDCTHNRHLEATEGRIELRENCMPN